MKKILSYIFASVLLVASLYINFYYWRVSEIDELRELPPMLLSALIIYLLIQLVKKSLNKNKVTWYDWIYYLGIVGIIIPLVSFFSSGDWLFTVTRIGALLLLLPPIVSIIKINNQRKKENSTDEKTEGGN